MVAALPSVNDISQHTKPGHMNTVGRRSASGVDCFSKVSNIGLEFYKDSVLSSSYCYSTSDPCFRI